MNLATGPMLGPPKPSATGIDHLLKEMKLASSTWNGFLTKEVTSSVLAKNIMVTFFNYNQIGKGQTISKAICGLLNSPKKRTKCTQDSILSAFR
jgi:hypothetical protein